MPAWGAMTEIEDEVEFEDDYDWKKIEERKNENGSWRSERENLTLVRISNPFREKRLFWLTRVNPIALT
jgi:hypothetical protein